MTEPCHRVSTLPAADDHEIHVQVFEPAGDPRAVIQILHGLGEHADRYARFAGAAAERGYAVCIHNHRGHGSETSHPGYFSFKNGWQNVVGDAHTVNAFVRETFPGKPVVLLGHSLGSYVAENYAMLHGGELAGLLLSASTWPPRLRLAILYVLARIETWRRGAHIHSPLLDKLGFDSLNKRFEPARTGHDWLSRDEDEVDKYIADPLCGGPYTCGLWLDFLRGLFAISSDKALAQIPSGLPIMITGGELDPVGGDKGMTKLLQHFAQTSHQRIKYKVYPEGRHEMLNEINRDEVTADWLDWIDSTTHSAH